MQTLQEKCIALTEKYESERAANEKLTQFRCGILTALEKMSQSTQQVESVLSCLSCLEYLKEPALTLVCGHSICKNVSHHWRALLHAALESLT